MKFPLGHDVCGMGFFCGVKSSKVRSFWPDSYPRNKPPVLPGNTEISSRGDIRCHSPILHVLGMIRFAKICPSVVGSDAIDVVNSVFWICACHVEKGKAVAKVFSAAYFDAHVSFRVRIPGNSSRRAVRGNPDFASKHARFGIVVEQFAQLLCGKIIASHEAPCLLIGQKPADICRVVRASSFYAICRANVERLSEARDWYTDLRERVNKE